MKPLFTLLLGTKNLKMPDTSSNPVIKAITVPQVYRREAQMLKQVVISSKNAEWPA